MILKLGDNGPKVLEWQQFLGSIGYGLTADGDFGPKTKLATTLFQHDKGLDGDGIVGRQTILAAAKLGFSKAGLEDTDAPVAAKRTVLVSAGHTNIKGQDRGAEGNGFIEGVESTRIRDAVAVELKERGIKVVEDGFDGENDPLKKALTLIAGTDLAVEFHFNAGPKTATGIEVLSKPGKKKVAARIAEAIAAATGLKLRGEGGWKVDSSGQHHRLAFCEKGGLIVEVGFISNPKDMEAYRSNFDQMVTGIADALAVK